MLQIGGSLLFNPLCHPVLRNYLISSQKDLENQTWILKSTFWIGSYLQSWTWTHLMKELCCVPLNSRHLGSENTNAESTIFCNNKSGSLLFTNGGCLFQIVSLTISAGNISRSRPGEWSKLLIYFHHRLLSIVFP